MSASQDQLAAALSGRFAIERLLATGGMAHVYLAQDLRNARAVALKVLRPEFGAAIGAERFLTEIRTTAQLVHPHILPLLDSGEAEGVLWFTMPYVSGETLRARLQRETQLPVEDALRLAREVASALDAAHRRGVVHRDIKPENILLQDGSALVADFGIALAAREAGGTRLTESGFSLGTPNYMSPEQATGERQIDARTDVYSLGAVLYEMLTGEPPHRGATVQATIAKLLTEAPVPPRTVRPTVTPALEAVVLKALAKPAADRHASARALLDALQRVDDGGAPTTRIPTKSWLAGLRSPAVMAAGVLLAATVAIATFASFRSASDDVPLAAGAVRRQITTDGRSRAPALSPDGLRIAYAVRTCDSIGACEETVELQDLAGAGRTTLARRFGGIRYVAYSPNGRWLLVQGTRDERFGAYLLPAIGGEPRFLGCCYGTFLSNDTVLNSPLIRDGRPRAYLLTLPDGVIVDSLMTQGVRADAAVFDPAPGGKLLSMVGYGGLTKDRAVILRRDGQLADTLPSPTYDGAARWSNAGDALYWTEHDPDDPRLVSWFRYGVDPATGQRAGGARPILTREASMFGSFDMSHATGDMAIELSSRRYVGRLLTRAGNGYTVRPVRSMTAPVVLALRPDGQAMVVGTSESDSVMALTIVDWQSGAERALTRLRRAPTNAIEHVFGIVWESSGALLAVQPGDGGSGELVRIDAQTGVTRVLARLVDRSFHAVPVPGGDVVLYRWSDRQLIRVGVQGVQDTLKIPDSLRWTPNTVTAVDRDQLIVQGGDTVWRLDWNVRRLSPLGAFHLEPGPITMMAQNGVVYIARQNSLGLAELLRMPVAGGAVERVALLPSQGLTASVYHLSADLSRAVMVGIEENADIWLIKNALGGARR